MWIPRRELVERIHDHMLARMGGESGPLNPNLLDAAIERSKTAVYGLEPFRDTIAKAAAVGFGIIAWHPFLDGNKRTAVFTMQAMLKANGIEMVIPLFIVKYTVQVALPPESEHHIDEATFIGKISDLCYASDSITGYWKRFRYSTYPKALLRGYIALVRRFPNWQTVGQQLGDRIFDWYAARDKDTMVRTLSEWDLRSKQGYPKEVASLMVHPEDFEDTNAPK
jgi:prophage maintenance system killer protein